MAGAKLTTLEDNISKKLTAMISRKSMIRSFLQTYLYPHYIEAQTIRFQTEGASQGKGWPALSPAYAQRKLKLYKDMPGGGRRINVATGTLMMAILGTGKGHFKVINENSLTVGVKDISSVRKGKSVLKKSLEYAGYVDMVRPIFWFSSNWNKEWKRKFENWFYKGEAL